MIQKRLLFSVYFWMLIFQPFFFFSAFLCILRLNDLYNLIQPFMNKLFRGLIAAYGAKKLGGGCLGTIIVFIVIWVALGQCS